MNDLKPAHPSPDQLTAFSQGRLNEAELAELYDHLGVCAECVEKVEASGDDTLISLLRSASTEHEEKTPPNPWEAETVAPDAAAPLATGLPVELAQHSRYRVLEMLGVGGMGAVYKAEHLLMERPVALKVINRSLTDNAAMVQRFRREVKAAARLTHANIVHAYDAEQAGDVHFLVMEYIEGKSLARVVAEQGPLSVPVACDYIRQAALGLQHAHEQGMVHRDIKPQNLMVTPSPLPLSPEGRGETFSPRPSGERGRGEGVSQIKILDFGLARFAMETAPAGGLTAAPVTSSPGDPSHQALTQVGSVMGTPDYIAPEQARDAHTADIRADIYSLGCTLYNLLAGHAPYPEGTVFDKVMAHMERTPQPLTALRNDVPRELDRVVERMLAKDPAKRFQTPAEVAQALQPFLGTRPAKPGWSVRRRLAAALLTAAVFIIGVTIYIQTDKGEFVIQASDENVEVMVNKQGVKIRDPKTDREYLLKVGKQDVRTGEYTIDTQVLPDGVEIEGGKSFTVKRGGQIVVTAKLRPRAEQKQAEKSDDERIQGTWKAIHIEGAGVPIPAEQLRNNAPTLTVTGNDVSYESDAKSPIPDLHFNGRVHLDPSKKPKAIDFFYLGKDARPMLGIYRLEGDTLTLCASLGPNKPEDRPTEFSTKGTDRSLIVWQRVRDAESGVPAQTSPPTNSGRLVNSFGVGFRPITRDGITEDEGGWRIETSQERVVRLYEVKPPLEECLVTYRAKMKAKNLEGKAYLEMWCRWPTGGEYFSNGVMNYIRASADWQIVEIPFVLQKGEHPDLFKLNVHVQGKGTVWIKDIELWQAPLPPEMKRPSNLARRTSPDDGILLEFDPSKLASGSHGTRNENGSLRVDASQNGLRMELPKMSIKKGILPPEGTLFTYRAQMKASNLQAKAYLVMRAEFDAGLNEGEFVSRGLVIPLTGSSNWASYETSLVVPNDEFPDSFKLTLVIEGKGTVWIKDVQLLRGPPMK